MDEYKNNLKSVHLVIFKVCTFFSPHTHTHTKKGLQTQPDNGTKKTKKKLFHNNPQTSQKKKKTLYPRTRDIFLFVGLSLCLHRP